MVTTCGVTWYRLGLMGKKAAARWVPRSLGTVPPESDAVPLIMKQALGSLVQKNMLGFQVVNFRGSLLQLLGKSISGKLGAHGKLQPLLRQEKVLWKVGIW